MGVDPAKDVVERVRIAADVDAGPRLIRRGRIECALAGERQAGGVEGEAPTERVGDRVALVGSRGACSAATSPANAGSTSTAPATSSG